MKHCEFCAAVAPPTARFCMQCGRVLPAVGADAIDKPALKTGGLSMFALSLVGSILLSLVLMFVFKLPIFFLAGFLPLFWRRRQN